MFLFLAGFFFAGPALAASAPEQGPRAFPAAARIAEVARSPAWRRLLHYRDPIFGAERSDIDDPAFFFAAEGKRDAEAELRATLEVFLDPVRAGAKHGPIGQAAICAFPARRHFLANAFGEELGARFVVESCTDFQEWSKSIAATRASLVFAAAYPNNPASMFGHTFLRLDRGGATTTKQADLLSYGVNFSATIGPDENPVKYAIWGLVGGYVGRYDLSPYYRKVNEYAFAESRDLWEYRLSLTEAEVAQLVRHIWELYGQGGLKYYFLDENCSFQILTALEAVRPDWDLSSGFLLSAIPVDTVRHVTRIPGAIESMAYRPSLRNEMAHGLARLADDERRRVDAIHASRAKAFTAPDFVGLSAPALDSLVSALVYEKARRGDDPARASLLRAVLVERSRRGRSEPDPVPTPDRERPDFAHGSTRVGLAAGRDDGASRGDLRFSGFHHDFLDRTPSYNLFSEVRLFAARVQKTEGSRLHFEDLDLLAMASYAPDSAYDGQRSWRVDLGWERVTESAATGGGARAWRTSGGYGFGRNLGGPRNLVYALAAGEFEKSGLFRHGFRFSPGADLGAIFNPGADRYFVHARALLLWDASAAFLARRFRPRFELAQSYWLTRQTDLRLGVEVESRAAGPRWRERYWLELGVRY